MGKRRLIWDWPNLSRLLEWNRQQVHLLSRSLPPGTRCDCVCPTGYSGRACEVTQRRTGSHSPYIHTTGHALWCHSPCILEMWKITHIATSGLTCGSAQQPSPSTAAGAAGVRGPPAAAGRRRGHDSATTQRPEMQAWSAGGCSRSPQAAYEC